MIFPNIVYKLLLFNNSYQTNYAGMTSEEDLVTSLLMPKQDYLWITSGSKIVNNIHIGIPTIS